MIQRGIGETVYRQVQRHLEAEIRTLHRPGDALPAEAVLAGRFGVNRHTLRRAIDGLVSDGWVERRHGLGSYVLHQPLDYDIGQRTRFTETLAAQGCATESTVLRKLRVPAQGGVAQRLQLEAGEPVAWIETLRSVDGVPFCVISHYLPLILMPGLLDDYDGGSLHEFIETQHGWRLTRTESLVCAALPQGADASLLAMPAHAPVLRVKSVNVRERDGTPVEYALTRFRADRMQLRITP
jgi:GntR family phosphonate transport system transcriptional regulator